MRNRNHLITNQLQKIFKINVRFTLKMFAGLKIFLYLCNVGWITIRPLLIYCLTFKFVKL